MVNFQFCKTEKKITCKKRNSGRFTLFRKKLFKSFMHFFIQKGQFSRFF